MRRGGKAYPLRLGAETKYAAVKSLLKLDTITSRAYLAVIRDLYASMMLTNTLIAAVVLPTR